MYRSQSLENKDLMSLYGAEGELYFVHDEDCRSEYDLESECSEDGRGGRNVRSSLSLEIHGLQRDRQVYFSNQEYYQRLEELKSTHLKNMAELETLLTQQGRAGYREKDEERLDRGNKKKSVSGPTRKLVRINSQEELDVHETSSGSDRSEMSGESNIRELLVDNPSPTSHDLTDSRNTLKTTASLNMRKGRHSAVRQQSKVTATKPFKMMLREEERKRNKVRTRSAVELENTMLRRELEELQECRKKFRASPAPVHIHLPLYEMIRQRWKKGKTNDKKDTQPFNFLEREKKKKEAKVVAELAILESKVERPVFKARPMPSTVYGPRRKNTENTSQQSASSKAPQGKTTGDQSDPDNDRETPFSPQRSHSAMKQIEVSFELADVFKKQSPVALSDSCEEETSCVRVSLRKQDRWLRR